MAVTYTVSSHLDSGPQRVGRYMYYPCRLTLSGTYATGGFAISANDFHMGNIHNVQINGVWESTESYTGSWDKANSKIKLGWTGGATGSELDEITSSDDVSNVLVDVVIEGT